MSKILMVLGNAGFAGSELYALDLAKRLKFKFNFTVDFIFFREGPMIDHCKKNGFEATLIKNKYISTLLKIIRTKKYAVIHAHQPMSKFICSISFLVYKLFCFRKPPFFWITIHTSPTGFFNIYNVNNKKVKAIIAYLRTYFIQIIAIILAKKVFLVSNHLSNYFPKFLNKKMSITYNHFPIELENYISDKIISNNSESFLYCGGSDSNKGFKTMKDLVIKLYDYQFIFVGRYSDDDLKFLDKPNITVLGLVQPETIWNYMRSVRAVVMPSKYETFGRVALEAALLGCPVILSRTGGLVEIFSEEDVLFCEPEDIDKFIYAIKFALVNPAIIKTKASEAQQKVKNKFNFEIAAKDLINEYKSILNNN